MAYNRTWEDPERLERERPIGSKAIVDGIEKLWAGPDLGYQSEATFNELQTEGYDGDQDYMLSGGWQARRAQLGINKVIEAVAPIITPTLPYAQQVYETITTPLQREALQIGGKGLMWGLDKIDQGVSAGSRALGIHPFWGNTAIETVAELATPTVSTTALKYGGKVWKAADIAELGYIPSRIHEATRTSARALDTVESVGAAGRQKVNAFERYASMVEEGYDMTTDGKIQRLINKVDSADNLPKHIKQYTDEGEYRQAVKAHIDVKGNKGSKTIRTEVGVLVDPETGTVRQMQKRGNKGIYQQDYQLRSSAEQVNTDLNRELSRFSQSPKYTSYKNIENVRHFMREIEFEGTPAEFQKLYELHHVNAIKVYQPFFSDLTPKQAEELRKLAEGAKIYLGNDPRNLVPLLKRKHRVDPDSIHTFMRENGIEGSSKWPWLTTSGNKLGSYNPQERLIKLLEGRSVQERFEVMKGFQEWVQQPANEHLSKLIEAQKLKGTIAK